MPKKSAPEHEWPDVTAEPIVCPECGQDVIDAKAHADSHWSPDLVFKKLLSPEAQARRAELLGLPAPEPE